MTGGVQPCCFGNLLVSKLANVAWLVDAMPLEMADHCATVEIVGVAQLRHGLPGHVVRHQLSDFDIAQSVLPLQRPTRCPSHGWRWSE